jgi:hypothetical protein
MAHELDALVRYLTGWTSVADMAKDMAKRLVRQARAARVAVEA